MTRPTLGTSTTWRPIMSDGSGVQMSGVGLLSPCITNPSRAVPPTMRWMTSPPSPGSPSGTRYGTTWPCW